MKTTCECPACGAALFLEERGGRRELSQAANKRAAVAEREERCPKCGAASPGETQHGVIRFADESGDGLTHDGGCNACCCCQEETR